MKKDKVIYVDFHSKKKVDNLPNKNINVLTELMNNIKKHLILKSLKKPSSLSDKFKNNSSERLM